MHHGPIRKHHFLASILFLAGTTFFLGGCVNSHVTKVEEFRAARKAGDLDLARSFLTEDPRVWYEEKEGEGSPWTLGGGRWKQWDTHFNGKSELGPWHIEGDTIWAVAEEMNDYFRLIERQDMPRYRITYYFDERDRLAGYMISAADPDAESSPMISRYDEFEAWALANDPDEWEYLRPGGSLDPTGDRAERTRVLANKWRATVGLAALN